MDARLLDVLENTRYLDRFAIGQRVDIHLYRVTQIAVDQDRAIPRHLHRSEEHTSELQSLMRISYAVFCLKKKKRPTSTSTAHSSHHLRRYQCNSNTYTAKQDKYEQQDL